MAENAKYSYTPPESTQGKHCAAQCSVGKNSCEQLCVMKHPRCWANARNDAQKKFNVYKNYQLAHGLPVKKRVQNFENTDVCKHECHCRAAFNVCYSACGGQVI
jgi:hypothetical protein